MQILTDLMERHRRIFFFYAFLISFIYSDNITSEYLHLNLDPIGYSMYMLDKYYPHLQPDIINEFELYDSRLNTSYSVYSFDRDILLIHLDSAKTKTMINYHQGDYGYRKLGLNLSAKTTKQGILKLSANTTIYPGPNNNYGSMNAFQNYLLSYNKKINYGQIHVYSGYHIEDEDLYYINTHSGESYLGGIGIENNFENLSFSFSHSYQIGNKAINSTDIDYSTFWTSLDISYAIKSMKFISSTHIKSHKRNMDEINYSQSALYKLIGLEYYLKSFSLNLSYNQFENYTYPSFVIKYNKNFLLEFGSKNRNWMDYKYQTYSNYELYYITLGLDRNDLSVTLTPNHVISDSTSYNGIEMFTSYKNSFFSIYMRGNYFDTNKLLFNTYLETSFELHGNIFNLISIFPKQKRFDPYVKVTNTYIKNTGVYQISENTDSFIIYNIEDYYKWSNFMNIETGINIKNFTLLWKFENILDQNIPTVPGGKPNYYHQYFQVKWRFIE